jgi:uncharacterized membrane protein YfcA
MMTSIRYWRPGGWRKRDLALIVVAAVIGSVVGLARATAYAINEMINPDIAHSWDGGRP